MGITTQTVRVDPYRSFNFLITLVDSANAPGTPLTPTSSQPSGGFSECSGLEMSMDIEEYKEGGNNATILRFPTCVKWANLRLKRGITVADDLWLWHFGFVQGQVVRSSNATRRTAKPGEDVVVHARPAREVEWPNIECLAKPTGD